MEFKPNWKETFRDFPEIPKAKRWSENHWTPEQNVTRKLISREGVDKSELDALEQSIGFYKELIPRLKAFSINGMTPKELDEFRGYFSYAFNFILHVQNKLTVSDGFFRLVKNQSVPIVKGRIREAKHLSYPPLDVVKSLGRYNRANTPNYNLFYATDSIDTALLELKPNKGEVVTIGYWIPKNGNSTLNGYPVTHNPLAVQVNPATQHGYLAFQDLKEKNDPKLMEWMEILFNYISHEFAKPVENHLDYYFSAAFSEQIISYDKEKDWIVDCIMYPSVGNQYSVDNIAIVPRAIDDKFKLSKAIQLEVTETFYSVSPPRKHPFEINVIKFKDYEETDWIYADGSIVW